jgi:pyridoxal 5'-phosphate synthase subunit Pdx1
MSDPAMITAIKEAVTIPVMAKARIGHFVEAQILESLGVDYIDESEVLTPADEIHHINKHNFKVPFVCGCRDLGEALRRVAEGASMIRTKGEAGTGNVVEAVRHCRAVQGAIRCVSQQATVPVENLLSCTDGAQVRGEGSTSLNNTEGQLRHTQRGQPDPEGSLVKL